MPSDLSALLADCTLCPRKCHVNRLAGQVGFCGQTSEITAARAALHFYEEPVICSKNGSGAVFFCGCNLQCIFCQNYKIAVQKNKTPQVSFDFSRVAADADSDPKISPASFGTKFEAAAPALPPISVSRLAEIFLNLQAQGACNINLVTGTHFLPQIVAALRLVRSADVPAQNRLHIPVVYNCGGYEEVSTLRLLDGLVDIYLPDCKYYDAGLAKTCCLAQDYFAKASAAIAEMVRQVGPPVLDLSTGLLKKGVIIRHMVLPEHTKDTKKILRYLHETYGDSVYVSIMSQYTPMPQVLADASAPAFLKRPLTKEEYRRVLTFAERIGIENGFMQEGDVASESFIPAFDGSGIL